MEGGQPYRLIVFCFLLGGVKVIKGLIVGIVIGVVFYLIYNSLKKKNIEEE